MRKNKLYWLFQFSGWTVFSLLNMFFYFSGNDFTIKDLLVFTSWIPSGIIITHCFRLLILRFEVIHWATYYQVPLAVFAAGVNAIAFYLFQYLVSSFLDLKFSSLQLFENLADILNLGFVFFVWSLIYFSYQFLVRQRKAEIEKLKWEANIKEIELNKLKSQLNPHFMFNCMNSIRALIDEDPVKAKEAVTQLSNILRNTLMIEKNNLIPFFDELKLVSDYLNLEKIRFEERLNYSLNAGIEATEYYVPPLLLQTLVENGIKHGISKLTNGGNISLNTELVQKNLHIVIRNTGFYDRTKLADTGYGIKSSQDRLKFLFGDSASITISNESPDLVKTEIILPLHKK